VQRSFVKRLEQTLEQSVDPNLEPLLRSKIDTTAGEPDKNIVHSLQRNRQWKAMIPIIVKEQQTAIFGISIVLFVGLMVLAFWTLRRITRPMKDLAGAADNIGRGLKAEIELTSGGALGRLQSAMTNMQEELARHRERAQTQGMEQAWRDIARVMAHEIKNPLTPIRLTLDRLQEKIQQGTEVSSKEMAKSMDRISGQVENLERLVNAFRSFAREPEARLKETDLAKCINKTAKDFEGTIKTVISGDGLINGDPYLLDQVFLNIWKNSIEAGASIMHVDIKAENGKAVLLIKDNGSGLDADQLEKVWVPYVTFKKQGTGLGLPVVKRLVESMNASVSLESGKGGSDRGLTVKINFPGVQS
jgi:nitrogen fixation/metabolism regulation signal transduction histidine kinase